MKHNHALKISALIKKCKKLEGQVKKCIEKERIEIANIVNPNYTPNEYEKLDMRV